MKKTLSIATFLILSISTAFAQREISVIPKAGVIFSNSVITFNEQLVESLKTRSSYAFGLYLRDIEKEKFIITTGIQYSSRGDIAILADTVVSRIENVTDYIDIPILVGFQPSKEFFQVKGGIQFSRLVNSTIQTPLGNANVTEAFKEWDVAALLEISYEFEFGLNLTARYSAGITNYQREPAFFPNPAFVYETRWVNFQILAGYALPIRFGRY